MRGKVKNLFDYPAGILVNQQLSFCVRVFPVPQRGVSAIVCALGKPYFHSGFYFTARVTRHPFIDDILEWGNLAFTVRTVHAIIDGDIADTTAGKIEFGILPG